MALLLCRGRVEEEDDLAALLDDVTVRFLPLAGGRQDGQPLREAGVISASRNASHSAAETAVPSGLAVPKKSSVRSHSVAPVPGASRAHTHAGPEPEDAGASGMVDGSLACNPVSMLPSALRDAIVADLPRRGLPDARIATAPASGSVGQTRPGQRS